MTTNEVVTQMTKKGNTLGFTASGEQVVCQFSAKIKAWKVWAQGEYMRLSNETLKSFSSKQEAAQYASSMISEEKTEEMKWW
jgi:hypothetical protein